MADCKLSLSRDLVAWDRRDVTHQGLLSQLRMSVGCRLRIVHRFSARREQRRTRGRCGWRRCSDCRAASPLMPRAATVCFAVFSLLIILLDLVRRRVVHCTRLRTPRPAPRPRSLQPVAPHHTC